MKLEDAKVLLIDDDEVMRMYVVNLLRRLGIDQIAEAGDGNTGLKLIERFRPDIVLSDIHMAPMNGLEFVKNLRQHRTIGLRKTPVLIMSADSKSQTLTASVTLGIAGYIIKPPIISALKVKLEHALKFRGEAAASSMNSMVG
jgi:CheY-like chemotaxis protein